MYVCCNCGWLVEFDDAIAPTQTGRCFCVYCWGQVNGEGRRVSKRLQYEIATEESDAFRNQKLAPDHEIARMNGET